MLAPSYNRNSDPRHVSASPDLPPFFQKEKADHVSMIGLYLCRQRPTLPHTFACSTIGPAGLNCRVRDGNGWIPRGKITDKLGAFARRLSRAPKSPAKPRDLYATYSQRTRERSLTTE